MDMIKPYYKLKEIDNMIHTVFVFHKKDTILYPRLECMLKHSNEYVKEFFLIQNRNNLPRLPTELLLYILELKYNIDNMNDLGILLMLNAMITFYNNPVKPIEDNYYGLFRFIDYNSFKKLDKTLFNLDISVKYLGMGHCIILSIDKESHKFFLKYDGGSNYYDTLNYIKNNESLNKKPKFKSLLFNIKELITKINEDEIQCMKSGDIYSPYTILSNYVVE
jgi:hypothetical protein